MSSVMRRPVQWSRPSGEWWTDSGGPALMAELLRTPAGALEMVSDDERRKLGSWGVIASMQPN